MGMIELWCQPRATAPDLVEQLEPILSQEAVTIDLDGESAEASGKSAPSAAAVLDRLRHTSDGGPYVALIQRTLAWRAQILQVGRLRRVKIA
jgi:hypothetical protein